MKKKLILLTLPLLMLASCETTLFPDGNGGVGINATRLVVRACELRIIDIDNLRPDEE